MKLDLRAPEGALSADQGLPVQVQGDSLYGAPAVGNRLQAIATLEGNWTTLQTGLD